MVGVMSVGRRLWQAPLWAHVLILGVALLGLLPLMAPGRATFSPDEAVVLAQSRSLAGGGGWIVEHPFAEVDPGLRFFPVAGSSPGDGGMAPFAKHPAYPLVLAGLDAVGGMAAMVALSVLGTLAAAALAALLAREVAGGLERPVLWAVGGASPLLFDAYLLIAHSVGAALVTGATLAVVRGVRRGAPAWAPAVASLLVALAVLLRTEALIFALALGAGTAVTGLVRRRPATAAGGVVVGAAGVVAAVAERWWAQGLVGASPGPAGLPTDGGSYAGARLEGFLRTWLRPSLEPMTGPDMVLVVVTGVAAAAVLVLRGRAGRPQVLVVLSVAATAMTAFALVADPARVVPGLLVAYPLAVFGVGLVDRASFEAASGRLVLTVTGAVFVAGVLATQYRVGGSAEWGGRYFALVVPVLTVLAVDALARRAPALPAAVRGGAVAGLVACSALMAVGALASMHSWHGFYERMLTELDRAGRSTAAGDGGGPVVVTAHPNLARRGWPTLSEQRWLYDSGPERGGEPATRLAARLQDRGVEELVFVGRDDDDIEPYLEHYVVDPDRSFTLRAWEVSTLVARR
jgi:hypothetical protein